MGRRRLFGARANEVAPEVRRAGEVFAGTLGSVEDAKAALVTAVRSGRAPGAPLAEALAGFELALADADASMTAWRVDQIEADWTSCRVGLDEARNRAEAFRLSEHPPEIYEELIAELGDLMDPLDAFEAAAAAFGALGVRV
jgi:hypothetical protein